LTPQQGAHSGRAARGCRKQAANSMVAVVRQPGPTVARVCHTRRGVKLGFYGVAIVAIPASRASASDNRHGAVRLHTYHAVVALLSYPHPAIPCLRDAVRAEQRRVGSRAAFCRRSGRDGAHDGGDTAAARQSAHTMIAGVGDEQRPVHSRRDQHGELEGPLPRITVVRKRRSTVPGCQGDGPVRPHTPHSMVIVVRNPHAAVRRRSHTGRIVQLGQQCVCVGLGIAI
jgi:hypothetical protein